MKKTVMIDTSVWIALLNYQDSCHEKAMILMEDLVTDQINLYDFTYSEVLTVLRNKTKQINCQKFIELLEFFNIQITLSNLKVLDLANILFFHFQKLSFPDCLLMASAKFKKAKLLTFDKKLQKAWTQIQK